MSITLDPDNNFFYSSKINDNRFFSGFTTKEIGDARDLTDIMKYFLQINLNYKSLITLEQIHSVNIKTINEVIDKKIETIEETDGVITKKEGLVLTVKTADCIPIAYCDKKAGIIGISHNGWRGSLKRMAQKMIDKIINLGGNKKNIIVALGPSIGSCCYDIDFDRYCDFLEEFDGYSDKVFQMRRGNYYINLSLLNFLQLTEIGVKKSNIDFFPFCTCCDRKRFHSYRRNSKKNYAEMLSFIVKL